MDVGATRASPDHDPHGRSVANFCTSLKAPGPYKQNVLVQLRCVRTSRRTPRLAGFDYTRPGAYFVTTCTYRRQCLFGWVAEGRMSLSDSGRIVEEEWLLTAVKRRYIVLDAHVVMPNHFHGVIILQERPPNEATRYRQRSLSSIMGAFKAAASRRITEHGEHAGVLWQRSFHERVIRDHGELTRIREYIATNPARWWHKGDALVAPTS